MSFAMDIKRNIERSSELERLVSEFSRNPSRSVETTLSYSEASQLGFVITDTYQGRHVSLPENSQYGDH